MKTLRPWRCTFDELIAEEHHERKLPRVLRGQRFAAVRPQIGAHVYD